MIKSEIVEIDGVFVGVVIQSRHDGTRVFRAIHEWLSPLNGQIMASLQDARMLAAGLFRRQRVAALAAA
ncbi:hypothetical protein GLI01_10100 [Gluconacetobacter liquefaciens]|uniref:Uncharacterized protein n=1 Tax=Gluconacetobacter liquefaciens TaxID=89584 RepID=A0A370G3Y3_GLULI|nr:hypothetical protein [Gluconacetobacter liquefaciens]MBB2186029.1 hypothetical protein [Gluconacetobacter liquefaciens]RDI38561.1 hypothetical protein C7453_10321 [Gluconacetobacter liquefaciens]GBR04134.1 hypothetical protein AA0522_1847 [Gluconacetobacter liquefaciens NRIC 0522]GEB36975.1 hypothetical protein GLI01_10100 [Gluconacetobacter liquefaciens]